MMSSIRNRGRWCTAVVLVLIALAGVPPRLAGAQAGFVEPLTADENFPWDEGVVPAGDANNAQSGVDALPNNGLPQVPPDVALADDEIVQEIYDYWFNNSTLFASRASRVTFTVTNGSPSNGRARFAYGRTNWGPCTVVGQYQITCTIGSMPPNGNTLVVYAIAYTPNGDYLDIESRNEGGVLWNRRHYAAPPLSSPNGTINTPMGNPNYVWNDTGAEGYEFAIWNSPTTVLYVNQNIDDGICNGSTCTFNPVNSTPSARLVDGSYGVFIRSKTHPLLEGGGSWAGPYIFTLDAPTPSPANVLSPTDTDTTRPTMRFTLSGDATYATHLYALLWRESDGAYLVSYNFERSILCGSATGTNCGMTLWFDLQDNTAYYFAILTIGAGGYPTRGGQGSNGWGYTRFTVDVPPPPVPSNINASRSGNTMTISWDDSSRATGYNIAWFYNDAYAVYYTYPRTAQLCNNGRCSFSFSVSGFAAGKYDAYVNAYGVGGSSTGGPYNNGFNGPATFRINN
ncbi:MAG: hypothetical protein SF029_11670 [bacterium]|nr:hypothetical protein [bacterium]